MSLYTEDQIAQAALQMGLGGTKTIELLTELRVVSDMTFLPNALLKSGDVVSPGSSSSLDGSGGFYSGSPDQVSGEVKAD
jgi:hypothetical protein